MSLIAYSQVISSGVDWIGNIPAHWIMTKVKHVCKFTTGWTPPTGNASAYEGENLWANISDLGERVVYETSKRISDQAIKEAGIALSPAGSLLFSFKLSIGQVSIAGEDMYTNEAIATFRRSQDLSIGYAFYAFPLFLILNASENIYGAKLLNQELIKNGILALPPIGEQVAIAAFLDRETGKIDALIAEQEKLLTLLAEKRQATISYAVTRGLNPNAPMKDSGVAWLGEVPAHWDVMTFQRCVFVAEGQVDPQTDPYKSMVLIAPNHIESGTGKIISIETAEEQGAESGKYLCAAGDVIYSKIRPSLRKVCLAPQDCICSADMYPMRGAPAKLCNDFLLWVMLSESFSALAVLESERVAMPKINRESLKAVAIALPKIDEQKSISAYLIEETSKFDVLKALAEEAIDLFKERRSALIAAAVTGKIDVRNGVAEEVAA